MKYYSKRNLLILTGLLFFHNTSAAPFKPSDYHNFKTTSSLLKEWANQYSAIMKLTSEGKTLSGNDIWAVTLSARKDATKAPAVLIVGCVEGTDVVASEICLQFIRLITTHYTSTDSIKQLLENTTFYIFPNVNPDASEAFFRKPLNESGMNAHSLDLDKDGLVDEDGPDDLNHDGLITMMRVTDPTGDWIADADIPALLRKADPTKGETGHYRLFTEGIDNDKDGLWNEDAVGGVNFNMNFPYHYIYFKAGTGMYPISERESRAVIDFAYNHPNIDAVFSFSPDDNLIHPWDAEATKNNNAASTETEFQSKPVEKVQADDAPYFKHIAERFQKHVNTKDVPPAAKPAGAFSEWAYYHFGRWSFSCRAWWPPVIKTTADSTDSTAANQKKSKPKDDPIADQRRLWQFVQATNPDNGFVPWTPIIQPDFPGQQVEVGGFRPFIGTNPPADSLESVSNAFNPFLVSLASSLPKLEITKYELKKVQQNAYRLELIVGNTGFLPTHTAIGKHSQWNPKIKIALIRTDNQKLLTGQKQIIIDPLPGHGRSEPFRWLIQGKPGSTIRLTVGRPATGVIEKTVVLP
ncbi:hypothetical protein JW960_22775 [candidate division KSB1 bacterium]|nr:hypothetical protein [candidate division KSB1 bacterium]